MTDNALLIGNSDGIGLAVSRSLLEMGWKVTGISRSASPITSPSYHHVVAEVQATDYPARLESVLTESGPPDLCIFCTGIGELLDLNDMKTEALVFEVNLTGMVKTAAGVIPGMVRRGQGHFIGLSSLADEMYSAQAHSYNASKAGFSSYLEGLALALKPKGVHVSNLRFGFVDTKMAKGDTRPFMIPVDRATRHVLTCIRKKPIRYTAPWVMIPLVKLIGWVLKLKVLLG